MEKEFKIKKVKLFSNKMLSRILNYTAVFIIVSIIIVFISEIKSKEDIKQNEKSIKSTIVVSSGNSKIDIVKFNEALDLKLKVFEEKLKESEKQRNENMKYYGTLVSFILAILGFFGFKSMHDTRQTAIEKAVFDAKKEAKDEASGVAKKTAEATVKNEIGILAKNETVNYLDDNLQSHLDKIEGTVLKEFRDRVISIESDINKLSRPESFSENERPKIFNDINHKLQELNTSYEKLKQEMFDFKNEELKKSIISELKKQ